MSPTTLAPRIGWRTPLLIVIVGCLVSMISFGSRSSLGFFQTPLLAANGWGRDVFGLALALQNLLWGAAQPLAGAIADRYGATRVLAAGALIYALGLVLMAYSSTPGMLHLTAGALAGFGIAGSSFTLVLGAFGKLLPGNWRSFAFGLGTAAGSFGQFVYSPLAVALIDGFGWQHALLIFGVTILFIIPLSLVLATPPASRAPGVAGQSLSEALSEALTHRSYLLLVLGFFTCGFQLQFITVHMPAYLVDRGLSITVGAWTIAAIGLFNIVGSLSAGYLASFLPKRYILSAIYFARALAVLVFISFPVTPLTSVMFGAVMGLLWLSTVPPTNGIIAVMFGTRWLTTLAGLAFLSHQIGGFLGVWIGGIAFERTGSYELVWWLSILFGVLSAIINLPIDERPVERTAPQAA
jgi:MFS family permease